MFSSWQNEAHFQRENEKNNRLFFGEVLQALWEREHI